MEVIAVPGVGVLSKFRLPLDLESLDGRNWRLIGDFTFGGVTLARERSRPSSDPRPVQTGAA